MSKPILGSGKSVQVTVDLEWLVEFAKAIDRLSYSCAGLCTHAEGTNEIYSKTLDFVQLDTEELKKESR
jgi:hypothetical protein